MLVLPKKTSHPLHTDSILGINRVTSRAEDYTGIHNINRVTQSESLSSAEAAPFTVSRASETPMSSRVFPIRKNHTAIRTFFLTVKYKPVIA